MYFHEIFHYHLFEFTEFYRVYQTQIFEFPCPLFFFQWNLQDQSSNPKF